MRPAHSGPAIPVIRVTRYDQVWSTLVAVLTVLMTAVGFLYLARGAFHPAPAPREQPIEIIEDTSGGV